MTNGERNLETEYTIGVYVHGADIVLDEISGALGTSPTKSWERADTRYSRSGKPSTKHSGLWCVEVEQSSTNLGLLVTELLAQLSARSVKITDLPGVESAHLSIFCSFEIEGRNSGGPTLVLDTTNIEALQKLGLSMVVKIDAKIIEL